jgi:hypothetical protein
MGNQSATLSRSESLAARRRVGLPRLTTGCSGRRCAPPLNRSVRPLGGYRPDWIRESELTGAFCRWLLRWTIRAVGRCPAGPEEREAERHTGVHQRVLLVSLSISQSWCADAAPEAAERGCYSSCYGGRLLVPPGGRSLLRRLAWRRQRAPAPRGLLWNISSASHMRQTETSSMPGAFVGRSGGLTSGTVTWPTRSLRRFADRLRPAAHQRNCRPGWEPLRP